MDIFPLWTRIEAGFAESNILHDFIPVCFQCHLMDLLRGQRLLSMSGTSLVSRADSFVKSFRILVTKQLLQVPLKQCPNLLRCLGRSVSFFAVARDSVEARTKALGGFASLNLKGIDSGQVSSRRHHIAL